MRCALIDIACPVLNRAVLLLLLLLLLYLLLQEAMSRPVSITDVQQELSVRGGLFPLMHLYPNETSHPGSSIPWTPEDVRLQQWLASNAAYQEAAAALPSCHA